MTPLMRLFALLFVAALVVPVAPAAAQDRPPTELAANINRIAALDFATRTNAARLVRRAAADQAVPALLAAIHGAPDEFVRYRALVLLTAFNDPGTPALMIGLLTDGNDRVREVAYRWLERHPDPRIVPTLLSVLQTEQAEFVRPALVRALAAHSGDPLVQRALVAEVGRGLDFFRSAVIEALGEAKATWAVASLTEMLPLTGPLQDDTVIALGRIGDARVLPSITALPSRPAELGMATLAARCLLGDDCPARLAALTDAISSRLATPETIRAGVAALAVVAGTDAAALDVLAALLSNAAIRDEIVIGVGTAALRAPERVLRWVEMASPARRDAMIDALRDGFERLEEDFAEEQFYAAARAAYWMAADGSSTRTLMASIIDKLAF